MAWALRAVYDEKQPFEILNSYWPDAGEDNRYWNDLPEEVKMDYFKQYYTDYDGTMDRIPPSENEAETVWAANQYLHDSKEKARLAKLMGYGKPQPVNPRSLPFCVWYCLDLMAKITFEWNSITIPKVSKDSKPEEIERQSKAYEAKDRVWRSILQDCESLERMKRNRKEVKNG